MELRVQFSRLLVEALVCRMLSVNQRLVGFCSLATLQDTLA
jgi:hypothetical protein